MSNKTERYFINDKTRAAGIERLTLVTEALRVVLQELSEVKSAQEFKQAVGKIYAMYEHASGEIFKAVREELPGVFEDKTDIGVALDRENDEPNGIVSVFALSSDEKIVDIFPDNTVH